MNLIEHQLVGVFHPSITWVFLIDFFQLNLLGPGHSSFSAVSCRQMVNFNVKAVCYRKVDGVLLCKNEEINQIA
jgi:hypothetical protein